MCARLLAVVLHKSFDNWFVPVFIRTQPGAAYYYFSIKFIVKLTSWEHLFSRIHAWVDIHSLVNHFVLKYGWYKSSIYCYKKVTRVFRLKCNLYKVVYLCIIFYSMHSILALPG